MPQESDLHPGEAFIMRVNPAGAMHKAVNAPRIFKDAGSLERGLRRSDLPNSSKGGQGMARRKMGHRKNSKEELNHQDGWDLEEQSEVRSRPPPAPGCRWNGAAPPPPPSLVSQGHALYGAAQYPCSRLQ